ncbi:hypothetical protein CsSME_00017240 [Camellia sinensis var. sinensis]
MGRFKCDACKWHDHGWRISIANKLNYVSQEHRSRASDSPKGYLYDYLQHRPSIMPPDPRWHLLSPLLAARLHGLGYGYRVRVRI